MKKFTYKKIFTDIIILFFVFFISFLVFLPFYKSFNVFITNQNKILFNKVKDLVGLDISYEKLSPALVARINLKNVSLKDTNGNKVASFENILVEYDILVFLFGKNKNPIKQITVTNGEIQYNEKNKNSFFAELFEQNPNQINSKVFTIPVGSFDIRLQNIFLNCSTENFDASFNIFSGRIFTSDKNIKYELDSKFDFAFKQQKQLLRTSFYFNVNGNTVNDFSSLSSVLRLNSLSINDTKFSNTSFFVSMQDKVLSLLAFQKSERLDIQASYDFEKTNGFFSLKFNSVKIGNIITSPLKSYEFLKNTSFTGFLSASLDLSELATEKLKFDCDISSKIPLLSFDNFKTKNLFVRLNANGNDKIISLNNLKITSDKINFNSYGYYNFSNAKVSLKASLNKFLLNNNNIKFNLDFYGLKKRYTCNLSDIEIGKAGFENIKATIKPNGTIYDIQVVLKDTTGDFTFDASYTKNVNRNDFLEVHSVLNSINVLNIYNIAKVFYQTDESAFIENFLKPFRITSEFYLTSDLKSISYNFIQLILASTEADGMYLLSSFNGSENTFNLENFNLNIGQRQITGNVNASFGLSKEVFFDSLFSVDGISYSAHGIFANNMLNIYGDYGLSVTAYLKNKSIQGSFELQEFPVPILPFVFSINSNFQIADTNDWIVQFETAKLTYTEDALLDSYNKSPFEFSFKGKVDPKNIFLSEIEMGNNNNKLKGQATFDTISNEFDFLKQFSIIAKLENDDKSQNFDLNCNFSIAEEIFLDGLCNIENISLDTFSNKQAKTDIINARLTFLGTLENILLQANLEKLKMHFNNKPLEANCMFLVDDGTVRIPEAQITWAGHKISSVDISFLPEKGKGSLSLNYTGKLAENEIETDINVDISGKKVLDSEMQMTTLEKIISVVESFVLKLNVKNLKVGKTRQEKPFEFTITRDNDTIAFYDLENKITGFYINDGTVSLNMADDYKTHLSFDGNITSEKISLQCYNIRIDFPQVFSFIPLGDYVRFYTGNLNGDLLIEGKLSEPQFYGTLYLDDTNFNSPGYAPDNLYADNIPILFDKYFIQMEKTAFVAKTFELVVECTSEFDGWIPYNTFVKCSIDKNKPGHMKTKNLLFHADGKVYCDITMDITPVDMHLAGSAFFDSGSFSIAFDTFDEFNAINAGAGDVFLYTMDLEVGLGKRAEYNWPNMSTPILTTLIPTEKPIVFDIEKDSFTITGLANIRGGEITYIKRNFYIKEGNLKFIETIDGFTPLLTLRAEIRDKDIEGKPVKLILNLNDQPLIDNYDTWITKITSDPAKSEQEVLQLLGQLVTADMGKSTILKDTLTNATDFASQITFAKNIENAIRDFLHLDVLSLRTQVLQNLVFGNLFKEQGKSSLNAGDYLDNTSLYFGKYFGSAIYLDAALHLSNYDPAQDQTINLTKPVYKNILFEPEIGLEMATPFFNLRWAISPTNVDSLFVDNTSLTFSWSFSY